MAYLTSEMALAQTLQPPAHTQGGHCPLLCVAILPVLSDVQQVQQIPNVSAHQTVHKVFSKDGEEAVSLAIKGGAFKDPDWKVRAAHMWEAGERFTLRYAHN